MPTWVILAMVVVIWAGLCAALVRIFPAGKRAPHLQRMVRGLATYLMLTGFLEGFRASLWFGAVSAASALPALLWYGPLPDGLPPAWDSRRLTDPRYARVEPRARHAGLAMAVLFIGAQAASLMFVQGP